MAIKKNRMSTSADVPPVPSRPAGSAAGVVLLVALAVVGPAGTGHAAPVITSVSGNVSHSQTVTISGASFGVKNPAAPVLWDDGTDLTKIGVYYGEHQPTAATEGNAYNMQYRDAAFLSSRNLALPNGRMSGVLAGAHACSNVGAEDCGYNTGNMVSLLIPMPRWPLASGYPKFYVQYWYRIDPRFDEVCTDNNNAVGCYAFTSGGENCKQMVISSSATSIFPGTGDDDWGYYQACNSDCPDVNYRGGIRLSRLDSDGVSAHSSCGGQATYHDSPINGWMQWIWLGGYDAVYDNPTAELWTFPDGHRTYRMDDGRPLTTFEIAGQPQIGQPDDSRYKAVGIGSFARVPRQNKGVNSFRYFAGVYADDTLARVVLTDNQIYESSTVVEPQIPSAWQDGAITVKVNLGKFAAPGRAFLFVFDAGNSHNATGFPVALGSDGDLAAPAPPQGVSAH